MGHKRSSSHGSGSSDSDSGSDHGHKHKEKKKDKKGKKDKKDKHEKHAHDQGAQAFPTNAPSGHSTSGGTPSNWFPGGAPLQPQSVQLPQVGDAHAGRAPSQPQPQFPQGQAQNVNYQRPPPSGFRVPLNTADAFPDAQRAGRPPCFDADGSPVYFGSALLQNAVHPCKVVPHLPSPCRVPYGGGELEHHGRYDLLPFTQDMELIPASGGYLPPGRRPVEGGYEEFNGKSEKLYHAVVTINGVRVPGKSGEHLRGANVAFGLQEHYTNEYELLVWRQ